ncbi:unnamed protein product [Adineta ricciae]|uniref:G-protein coupled receptors family 1 profile domain-containing protein n=1 Tax=Adineta ricciae TaxID=249248 RepID=A0A814TD63_ADIRI|nr:unnamed protein product [Adineta ricciae]CAF1159856.1 unnamed protein product [Adineta ricciae]
MSLAYLSQQTTIYVGLFLIVTGVIGNSLNVFVFSTVRLYRRNPCTFYFLIRSIDNIGFILVNLTVRIISVGYGYDLTRTSVVWCKIRQYILLILGLISFMLSCLAVIDQFLATSRNANLRRVSNISWAHRIVCLVLIFCCLYGIPALIFVDISPSLKLCMIANANYAIYISIHVLSFTCIIPVLVTVIFGYLTYRSIHSTRALVEQQVDRQLVRMVFSEVAIIVVSITPYGVNTVYSLITSRMAKDTNQLSIESFVSTITSLLCYFYYTVC